ncbi:MAG: tetratricopeptide repeat protein [Chloroflexia bacterium]|nr:tetratricopeptide repeat protein [Chloroflexia bacterium]
MAHLALYLLGPGQTILDDQVVTDLATDKVRALLYYLLLESDRPHRRDALGGLLWPDQPQDRARQSLRQALSFLRQALSDQDQEAPFLLVTRSTIQFNGDSDYWCDVTAFSTLIQACRQHRHRRLGSCRSCLERLQQAVELYQGPFLEGFMIADSDVFEEWALLKREWLQRQAVEALAQVTDYHERRGDLLQARQYAWRQVDLEPWREETQRRLMRLLVLDGQRSAALAQYEVCRRVLQEELGVEPTPETQNLHRRILRQEPLEPPHHSCTLPLPRTSFVGRQKEMAELAELLASPDCRLLSLLGPGGIGKTRLALQVALEHRGLYAHGVCFVSLASVNSVGFVVPAIADALGLDFHSHKPQMEQLQDFISGRELLLVLDNMEHLLEAANLLGTLLQCAPGLVLLVTSRERLNLQEEWAYQVSGLSYPEVDGSGEVSYSAVDLFLQRARQVDRHFDPQADFSCLLQICRLTEGMPLAIELAAAWVSGRSCREILRELEQTLDILATSLRNVPLRHRSVRASFEHSWGLLAEQERRAFAALSVFRGGFAQEAALQVLSTGPAELWALLQQSLLRRDPAGRYHMHQLLRQYAAEKLAQEPSRQAQLERQHALYYAAFLEQRVEALKGQGQQAALEEIRLDIDNVRRSWNWALCCLREGRDLEAAAAVLQQALQGLYLFYSIRCWYQEGEERLAWAAELIESAAKTADLPTAQGRTLLGRLLTCQGRCCEYTEHLDKAGRLLQRGLNLLEDSAPLHEQALPLFGLGYIAHMRGEFVQAESLFQRSLAGYRQIGDRWGVANVLSILCLVARRRGYYEKARQSGLESLAIRREIGDLRGVASSLNNLGLVYADLGEYVQSRQVLLEGREICQRLGHRVGLGNVLTGLCRASFRLGESQAAEQFCRQSLAVYQDIGDLWGVAIAYNNLARMAAEMDEHARAKPLYEQSIELYHRIGIQSGLGNTLANLGETCYRLGEFERARQHLLHALHIAWDGEMFPTVLKSLGVLGLLSAEQGQELEGLTLLNFALDQEELAQSVREQFERALAALEARAAPEFVARAREAAGSRQLADIVVNLLSADRER